MMMIDKVVRLTAEEVYAIGSVGKLQRAAPMNETKPLPLRGGKATIRESKIEAHLKKRVEALGGEVRKVQWIGRRGAPDRLVMLPKFKDGMDWRSYEGQTIWCEIKAPGVKPPAYQLREHARMRAMGQRVEVIDSIEGVERLLS